MSDVESLSADDFTLITQVLERYSGVVFGPEARSVLERRVQKRLGALGLATFKQYADFIDELPAHHPEIQAVLDHLTIKETYFLREQLQIETLVDEVTGRRDPTKAPAARVSIWSAGCSTGEEAYSIAMVFAESRAIDMRNVRIFGSDISRKSVESARKAVYGPSAFRAMPADLRNRYFIKQADGELARDILRAPVRFACANLLDRDKMSVVGQVDAIFCRNVLIYFGEAARREALEVFYDHLGPGGILCLGHSESLLRAPSPFEPFVTPAGVLYRRPKDRR